MTISQHIHPPTTPERTLRLILGDQLNPQHRWFTDVDPATTYVLMEVRQETDYVLHHAQKILAIFAAMRDLSRHLRALGHAVHYLAIDDPDNLQSVPANIDALCARYQATAFEYQAPDEWRLDEQLYRHGRQAAIPWTMVDTDHFLPRATKPRTSSATASSG